MAFLLLFFECQRLDPKKQGWQTYKEYLSVMPASPLITIVRSGDHEYLRVAGPVRAWACLPSGSAAYVFDKKGKLVDWTRDDGDDNRFTKKWGWGARNSITQREALQWIDDDN
jgi:hypothetical protein